MDCSLPGSSIHGIFQARILEWVAISFSRISSRSRDWTQASHIVSRCFYCLSDQRSLNRFNSTKKSTTTTKRGRKGKRKKKIQKQLQKKSKYKDNRYISWMSAVSVLSLAARHSLPHLPRMPSNTGLISGPAVETAQILIWSYSFCVFLPPMFTVVRTSVFSIVGSTIVLCIFYRQWNSWSYRFNLQLLQLVGRFWVLFLSHTAPGFQLWFYLYLCMWASLIAQLVKNPPAIQETQVQFLGLKDPLEKG